jgi:hypothetical protein
VKRCSVIANQAGNANYSAAPQVTESVNATLAGQTITVPAIPNRSVPGKITLTASASSGFDRDLQRDLRTGHGQRKHADDHLPGVGDCARDLVWECQLRCGNTGLADLHR